MNGLTGMIADDGAATHSSIDLEAFRNTPLARDPFPFLIVPGFLRASAHEAVGADFPAVEHPGSFPLSTLTYGPAFARFIDDIQSGEMTRAVAEKFGVDLSGSPTMVTVRGMSRAADGKIHTDSRTKLITALIYMNDAWESLAGRLRLLRTPNDINDVVAEVPPERGTMLMFRNDPNAWHGFESFSGPRRVIQLNWVTDESVVRREQSRHRFSACMKRLFKRS